MRSDEGREEVEKKKNLTFLEVQTVMNCCHFVLNCLSSFFSLSGTKIASSIRTKEVL